MKGDLILASALMGRNVELDLEGVKPEEAAGSRRVPLVYDLRYVQRIVPIHGRYNVNIHPGAVNCQVDVENGKVLLPGYLSETQVQSIEFLNIGIS